jgi:hypothetical protein
MIITICNDINKIVEWVLSLGVFHQKYFSIDYRALAIAIVTRRAETPEGWLGEERSDE